MANIFNVDEAEAAISTNVANGKYFEKITSKKAAEMLGISLRTLRRWERAGLTPPRDDPRYYTRNYVKTDIEAFAKAHLEAKTLRRSKRRGLLTVTS